MTDNEPLRRENDEQAAATSETATPLASAHNGSTQPPAPVAPTSAVNPKLQDIVSQLSDKTEILNLSHELAQDIFADENLRSQTFEQKAMGILTLSGIVFTLFVGLLALLTIQDPAIQIVWKESAVYLLSIIILMSRGVIAAVKVLDPRHYERLGKKDLLRIQKFTSSEAIQYATAKIVSCNDQNRKENKFKLDQLDIAITCTVSFLFMTIIFAIIVFLARVFNVIVPHDIWLVVSGGTLVFAFFADRFIIKVPKPLP